MSAKGWSGVRAVVAIVILGALMVGCTARESFDASARAVSDEVMEAGTIEAVSVEKLTEMGQWRPLVVVTSTSQDFSAEQLEAVLNAVAGHFAWADDRGVTVWAKSPDGERLPVTDAAEDLGLSLVGSTQAIWVSETDLERFRAASEG